MSFINKLYANIGGKIKTLAKVLFIIGAVAYIIIGLVGMFSALDDLSELSSTNKSSSSYNKGKSSTSSDYSYLLDDEVTEEICVRRCILSLTTLIAGPVLSLVATWCLYGFGELIEKSEDSYYTLQQINRKPALVSGKSLQNEEVPQKKYSVSGYEVERLMHLDNNTLTFMYLDKKITKEEYDEFKKP